MKNLFVLFAVVFFAAAASRAADSPVTIAVDSKSPGSTISTDFTGLSYEIALLMPNENGVRYFRPDNKSLINLFHTLGIKNLRIGGNSSDRDAHDLPSTADIDSLFAFAKAAGVKVIYCLRLRHGDPQADATTVKYIMSRYRDQVDCFSIGQEPSAYPVEQADARPDGGQAPTGGGKFQYSTYRDEWKEFADVITAAEPDVKFCGPSVHNNGVWAQNFMADFGKSGHISLITEHLYPGGAGGKVPTPEIGRDRMLSDSFTAADQKLYNSFAATALADGFPYRLEEVNNFYNGGAAEVSNTYASALWGLDFMYWWAAHAADGLNFHTGDRVAADSVLKVSKYTAFFSTTNGYVIRPLGYGIKAFDLGGHGQFVPANVSNPGNLNLSAYAVLGDDKNLYLTIINKEHGATAREAEVSVSQNGAAVSREQVVFLSAPGNDLAACSGETLGGVEIQSDGSWNGNWAPLDSSTIKIPPASAAIIKILAFKDHLGVK
ncbi:MAG TPA: hypothetical protein VNU95_10135 [Candidatus Acidoferrales bacterium]|nr:hypothetical protein [Candidatus Acidoferrales bacterium]